jgi:hypothetical protein
VPEGEESRLPRFSTPGGRIHRALFDFGDNSSPVEVIVAETHVVRSGRMRARHAWCDNGDYRVTVRVIDDDGELGSRPSA